MSGHKPWSELKHKGDVSDWRAEVERARKDHKFQHRVASAKLKFAQLLAKLVRA